MGGYGFDPGPRYTKVVKMVLSALLNILLVGLKGILHLCINLMINMTHQIIGVYQLQMLSIRFSILYLMLD